MKCPLLPRSWLSASILRRASIHRDFLESGIFPSQGARIKQENFTWEMARAPSIEGVPGWYPQSCLSGPLLQIYPMSQHPSFYLCLFWNTYWGIVIGFSVKYLDKYFLQKYSNSRFFLNLSFIFIVLHHFTHVFDIWRRTQVSGNP